MKEKLIQLLREHEVSNLDDFKEEINSYSFIELIMDIEDAFSIHIEDEMLVMDKMCSITSLMECIDTLTKEQGMDEFE